MQHNRHLLVAFLIVVLSGCVGREPLPAARRGAAKADAAANTVDQQLKDAAARLSDTINRVGADAQTPETTALTAITKAFTTEAGAPDDPVSDPTDILAIVSEWEVAMAVAREANDVLRAEYEKAAAEAKASRAAIADLEKQNLAMRKSLAALKPVVSTLYWGLLGVIGVITICGVAYYALIRRLTSPTMGTISAVGWAVAGASLGVVWYIHGQALIGWGIIAVLGGAAVAGINYWRKAELTDRLVASIQKFRDEAPLAEVTAFDEFMRDSLPSSIQDMIKRLKGKLFPGSG